MKRFPDWYRENRNLLGRIANFWLLPGRLKTILNAMLTAFDAILIAGDNGQIMAAERHVSLNDVWVKE